MVSPASDPFFSPPPRPASAPRETAPLPCTVCNQSSHKSNDCPSAAETLMRANTITSGSWPVCGHCRSAQHHTIACPRVTDNLAQQAFRLHNLEPFARYVLKTGVPREAPCCEKHLQMGHALLTTTLGHVLQSRTLMPMCVDCVVISQQEFKLEFDVESRSSLDTCNCAAFVFDNTVCQWCAVEELGLRRAAYKRMHTKMLRHYDYPPTPYLECACTGIPMGTPNDGGPPAPITREVLRYCTGCTGVVNVPLHHLDGETHLACIPGRPSQALLGEDGLVAASVEGEPVGMGLDETCSAHPVRTVAQAIVANKRRDSGLKMSRSNGARGRPPVFGHSEMRAQSSAGLVAQSQVSGRIKTPLQASGETRVSSQATAGMTTRPPMSGGMETLQQRQVPVALMVPSTPEEQWKDDTSTKGQLNPGFKFPRDG